MRSALWIALAALAGCAAAPPKKINPPPMASVRIEAVQKPPGPATRNASPAAITASQEYGRAEKKEVAAVMQGGATVDSIDRIHQADIAARAAVRHLVSQDGHPTQAAKDELRRAMDELIAATEAKP